MAVLFTNNLAEVGRGVVQSQCFTVQDYHYHCFRERDDQGNPYGGILSEYLDFSVIVSSLHSCKFFCQSMELNENTPPLVHLQCHLHGYRQALRL